MTVLHCQSILAKPNYPAQTTLDKLYRQASSQQARLQHVPVQDVVLVQELEAAGHVHYVMPKEGLWGQALASLTKRA